MGNLLASLTLARIIERAGPGRAVLRITPRFLAHAERAAGRLLHLGPLDEADALEQALETWDGFHHDTRQGARFLRDALANQLGSLQPMYPELASFQAAA